MRLPGSWSVPLRFHPSHGAEEWARPLEAFHQLAEEAGLGLAFKRVAFPGDRPERERVGWTGWRGQERTGMEWGARWCKCHPFERAEPEEPVRRLPWICVGSAGVAGLH